MSERKAGFNRILDPSKFLCLAEVKKLREITTKDIERANLTAFIPHKVQAFFSS
jgi:hypothetical protein